MERILEPIELEVECRMCGAVKLITVGALDMIDYQMGVKLIQNCFPYLSANDREMLISCTCADCWNKMFPDENEDLCDIDDDPAFTDEKLEEMNAELDEDDEECDEPWDIDSDEGFDPYLGEWTGDC